MAGRSDAPDQQRRSKGDAGGRQGTVSRSVASTAASGTMAVIGGVSGFGGESNPSILAITAKRMAGIHTGRRAMLEQTIGLVAGAGIQPVVDRVFPFSEAEEAYRYIEPRAHFGSRPGCRRRHQLSASITSCEVSFGTAELCRSELTVTGRTGCRDGMEGATDDAESRQSIPASTPRGGVPAAQADLKRTTVSRS